jgi:hypothetical protein
VIGAVTAQYSQKAWFKEGRRVSMLKSSIGMAKNVLKRISQVLYSSD